MKTRRPSFIGISASSLVLMAACHQSSSTDSTTTTSANQASSSMAPTTPATPVTTSDSTMGQTPTNPGSPNAGMGMAGATPMTDAQLLQITHFANSGEIAQAKLANDKSKNGDVKKLAAMMISDHSDADKKGMDLAKKENITLADSPASMDLKKTADSLTTDMTAKNGADFDHAYVDAQVNEHQAVLDMLDTKLIPAAHDADVKSYLQDVRKAVAMHLDHAKKLQSDLTKGN